jgi:hypothetical protein
MALRTSETITNEIVLDKTTLVSRVGDFMLQAWRFNRPLTAAVILMTLLIPLSIVGMVIDPKVITGVNGWIKPLKFLVSSAIYGATFLWLLTCVKGRRWAVRIAATITGSVLLIEVSLIIMQVIRGRASHFNAATVFDAAVFSTMGIAITVLATMNLLLAVLLMFQRLDSPVFGWALRLGVLASFVGMSTAFLMTAGPTPEQLAAMQAGEAVTSIGAHSVGVADGGSGLPFLGWSTEGGDLRVPHFFGLHGMQVIPLLGWLLARPSARRRWNKSQRLAFVWIGGLTYIGWTILLTWQALRGQSVIAPDVQTWMMYGLLIGTAVFAAGVVLVQEPARQVDPGHQLGNASQTI